MTGRSLEKSTPLRRMCLLRRSSSHSQTEATKRPCHPGQAACMKGIARQRRPQNHGRYRKHLLAVGLAIRRYTSIMKVFCAKSLSIPDVHVMLLFGQPAHSLLAVFRHTQIARHQRIYRLDTCRWSADDVFGQVLTCNKSSVDYVSLTPVPYGEAFDLEAPATEVCRTSSILLLDE